jgi:hypothetical protein
MSKYEILRQEFIQLFTGDINVESAEKILQYLLNKNLSWTQKSTIFKNIVFPLEYFAKKKFYTKDPFSHLARQVRKYPPQLAVHLLGLLTFNYSGYIREAALQEIQKFPISVTFPYLFLRVNENVKSNREFCLKVLREHEDEIDLFDYVRCYDYTQYLFNIIETLSKEHANFKYPTHDVVTLTKFIQPIREKLNNFDLVMGVVSDPSHLSKEMVLFLINNVPAEILFDDQFITFMQQCDFSIAKIAYLRKAQKSRIFKDLFLTFIDEKNSNIQLSALRSIFYAPNIHNYVDIFNSKLMSSYKKVRAVCQYALNKIDAELSRGRNITCQEHYKVQISNNPNSWIADTGIIESHTGDIDLILNYRHHANKNVRLAFYDKLSLYDDRQQDMIMRGLLDSNAAVRKACINKIKKRIPLCIDDFLTDVIQNHGLSGIKKLFPLLKNNPEKKLFFEILDALKKHVDVENSTEFMDKIMHHFPRILFGKTSDVSLVAILNIFNEYANINKRFEFYNEQRVCKWNQNPIILQGLLDDCPEIRTVCLEKIRKVKPSGIYIFLNHVIQNGSEADVIKLFPLMQIQRIGDKELFVTMLDIFDKYPKMMDNQFLSIFKSKFIFLYELHEHKLFTGITVGFKYRNAREDFLTQFSYLEKISINAKLAKLFNAKLPFDYMT